MLDTPCGVIPAGTNTEAPTGSAPYPYGTTYTYVCSAGYTYGGDKVTTCNIDGEWTLAAPTCYGMRNSLT